MPDCTTTFGAICTEKVYDYKAPPNISKEYDDSTSCPPTPPVGHFVHSPASLSYSEEQYLFQKSPAFKLSSKVSMDSMTTANTLDAQYPETPVFPGGEFSNSGEVGVISWYPSFKLFLDPQGAQDYNLHADVSKKFPSDVHETSTSINQEPPPLQAEMLKCNSHSTYAQAPTPDMNTFSCPIDRAEVPSGPSSSCPILSKVFRDEQVKSQYDAATSIKRALDFLRKTRRQDVDIETGQNFKEGTPPDHHLYGVPSDHLAMQPLRNLLLVTNEDHPTPR
jgi:hypothetical protein